MIPVPRQFRLWGAVGAFFAAVFALWMFFFPSLIPSHFAWVVEPRLAQAFIGAGYVFRTFFFLLFVFEQRLAQAPLDALGQPGVHRHAAAWPRSGTPRR